MTPSAFSAEEIWIVDNGSLQPAATWALRGIATEMARLLSFPVRPVSLLHSSKIAPEALGGHAAETFERAVKAAYGRGVRRIWVQPYFIGPSGAISSYLPERLEVLLKTCPELEVRVGPVMVPGEPVPEWLIQVLVEHVRMTADSADERVVLVDHGTPVSAVNEVRNRIATALGARWAGPVVSASMERRPEEAYAFNEPLLERVFEVNGWTAGRVTVCMLFLSPGRHAGPGGDVARILDGVVARFPALVPRMTPLISEHPHTASAVVGMVRQFLPKWSSRSETGMSREV